MLMLDKTNLPEQEAKSRLHNCTAKDRMLRPGEEDMNAPRNKSPRMDGTKSPTSPLLKDGLRVAGTPSIDSRQESVSVESLSKTSSGLRKHTPASCKNPASVAKRNARERRRIKNVNLAFDELRQHVPLGEQNKKKISKVDTLQSAIEYIKALEKLVKRKREIEKSSAEYGAARMDTSISTLSNSNDIDHNESDDVFAPVIKTPNMISEEKEQSRRSSLETNFNAEPIAGNLDVVAENNSAQAGVDIANPNDSGYSDCCIPSCGKSQENSSLDLCSMSDDMDTYIPCTPLLGEVTPDDVDKLLDNASRVLAEPFAWNRNASVANDEGHFEAATSVQSQQHPLVISSFCSDYQGKYEPVRGTTRMLGGGSLRCAFATRSEINEGEELAIMGAEMTGYLNSHEGYHFGDAYT